jgi:enoyl-CoA hydratase
MQTQFVQVAEEGPVTVLTLYRPPVNALSSEMLRELQQVFQALAGHAEARAVILTGEGKAFVGGADIAEMRDMDPLAARRYAALGQGTFFALEDLPQPTIAAVNGYALGGGCELALACDLRVAADRAVFGLPEVNLGVLPGFGGTQRLPRLIGFGPAAEMIFAGETVAASAALSLGLVNRVVPSEELMPEARRLASRIASKAPIAVRLAKKAMRVGMGTDVRTGAALEGELLAHCFSTEDQKEGMEAFLKKRPPEFGNR